MQHHLITPYDVHYPEQLRQIKYPPNTLYIKGHPELLSRPQIAIVGSRNPTAIGREIAYTFAHALSQSGFCITSGLAIGIDGEAHRGALDANGETIAVLGSGLNRIYPAQHRSLAKELESKGLLISEFLPDAPPLRQHFPQRNRLISGLSLGILIVEATMQSGSLITASFALQQNREVFAIPGSIHNPLSKGCHFLIRQGAILVETPEDICQEFQHLPLSLSLPSLPHKKTKSIKALEADEWKLVECIDFHMTTLEQIMTRSGLEPSVLPAKLLNLELRGYIKGMPGGYIRVGQ